MDILASMVQLEKIHNLLKRFKLLNMPPEQNSYTEKIAQAIKSGWNCHESYRETIAQTAHSGWIVSTQPFK